MRRFGGIGSSQYYLSWKEFNYLRRSSSAFPSTSSTPCPFGGRPAPNSVSERRNVGHAYPLRRGGSQSLAEFGENQKFPDGQNGFFPADPFHAYMTLWIAITVADIYGSISISSSPLFLDICGCICWAVVRASWASHGSMGSRLRDDAGEGWHLCKILGIPSYGGGVQPSKKLPQHVQSWARLGVLDRVRNLTSELLYD